METKETKLQQLRADRLSEEQKRQYEDVIASPITVLQIGEGNFLRGFADWMLQVSRERGLFQGSVAVTQPRPSGKHNIDQLAAQDGLYTLVVRGLEDGQPVERQHIVSVFSKVFDPYENWQEFTALAGCETLRFVISNTTEAGIAYKKEPLTYGPIASYPGKMAYLLYERYIKFQGALDKGIIFLPCELLERNGDALRDNIVRYSLDWGYPDDFRRWIASSCRFLNSLVDRIVTGYPAEDQAAEWFEQWSYSDRMLTTAEPYHLWAIEGEEELDDLLPLKKAGLNVHWTNDLRPYQQRKVRILNASHTWMAPLGILHGVGHVRELIEHPILGQRVRAMVREEIIPAIPYSPDEMSVYADTVFERFANPFIRHRLEDIAMNSLSKFKVRLLPTLNHYAELGMTIPFGLATGLAGLLRYYRISQANGQYEGRNLQGERYVVRDNVELLQQIAAIWANAEQQDQDLNTTVKQLLALEALWEQDLSNWPGLADAICQWWTKTEGGEV
ncbi:altronate oxidoreductase [Paenibacillus sp. CCS19]|uniref:tagaturonate reductase n=1 Tax=Paenibacillus sp. CCS19 TaxID=3158387 RepID=UPI0025649E21|nr:tagaturonate reductase [Paenibacillus cellulosilyticus]GMK37505.1 altronate oxidoreductase [Paenibacillus cellulosilyticus]